MNTILTDGKSFKDELGRERIFHGINVCDKGTKIDGTNKRIYMQEWPQEYFDEFRRCGFNIIRFGITWDAVEPQPGKYDDAYLDSLGKILDRCEENGLYCYIDMHQDLYSYFEDEKSWGDGAPKWACLTDGYKYKFHHFTWAEGYFWGRATQHSFDSFWENKQVNGKGLRDYYADMWLHVATRLGSHPAVIGFDLMNEPFMGADGGKIFKKIILELIKVTLCDPSISKKELIDTLIHKDKRLRIAEQYTSYHMRKVTSKADALVKKFDTERYTPFINETTSKIRTVNKNGIVFLENCYYSNLAIPCCAGEITVDGKRDKSFGYAPHTYDLVADSPMYKYAGTNRIKAQLEEPRRMQERLDIPVVFGEWGGYQADTEWYYHCEYILDTFDKYHWSDTYWAYFPGLFESPIYDGVLNRPYPRAVAGKITEYRHDRENNAFTLSFEQPEGVNAPTEIYAHKPVKSVKTDGKYQINKADIGCGAVISISTEPGTHSVIVEFEN